MFDLACNQDGNKVVVGLDLDAFHRPPKYTSNTCCVLVGCVCMCENAESENSFGRGSAIFTIGGTP
jgi:hypothetical protein